MDQTSGRWGAPTPTARYLSFASLIESLGMLLPTLEADPMLQGREASGVRELSPELLQHLAHALRSLECYLDQCAGSTRVLGNAPTQQVTGAHVAYSLLVGHPVLCEQLLRLAALAVRWPPYDTWPPGKQEVAWASPPSTAATAASPGNEPSGADSCGGGGGGGGGTGAADKGQAVATVDLATSAAPIPLQCIAWPALGVLGGLMQYGPLEQSCRLACTLLRMHTLEACSRSLDTAVGRLGVAERGPAFGLGSSAAAVPTGAADAGGGGLPPAVGGSPAQGALEALRFAGILAGLVLRGLAALAMRLGPLPAVTTGDAASGAARAGLMAAGSAASPVASSSGCSGNGTPNTARSAATASSLPHGSPSAALAALLREALPGSGLVEHLARGLLHLVRAEGSPSPATLVMLEGYTHIYSNLSTALDSVTGLTAIRGAVLGSPCARYLATAVGLHALCTADGGPPYGMPPMMTEAGMSSWWMSGRAASSVEGDLSSAASGCPGAWAVNQPLFALAYGVMHRPPTSNAALAVLRRLVVFAFASAQHEDDSTEGRGRSGSGGGGGGSGLGSPSGGGSGGGSSVGLGRGCEGSSGAGGGGGGGGGGGLMQPLPPPGLPLSGSERTPIAATALTLYRQRIQGLSGPRRQEADAELWRLTVAAVRHTVKWASGEAFPLFSQALHVDLGPFSEKGTLPPQPPPALAAALSAGLLPCLERLARRAERGFTLIAPGSAAGASPEARLWTWYLSKRCDDEPYLPWLLAYGSPTEAAALITSMGKLMRTAAANGPLTVCEEGLLCGTATMVAAHTAASTLTRLAGWVEHGLEREHNAAAAAAGVPPAAAGSAAAAGAEELVAAPATAGGPESGPAAQLRRMAVLAACEWLPVLSGMVIEAAKEVLRVSSGGQQSAAPRLSNRLAVVLRMCMQACNTWLPFGAIGAEAATGGSGGAEPLTSISAPTQPTAAGAAAAGGPGGAGGLGGRRLRLLAREARVVELLGAGMRLEAHMRDSGFLGGAPDEKAAILQLVERMLNVCLLIATDYPSEAQRALTGAAAAAGSGFPAQCTWSSGVVGRIVRDLPRGIADGKGDALVSALAAWERGGRGRLGFRRYCGPLTRAVKCAYGHGLLEVMEEEVHQPSPLRRCCWWRCTNLAGDSEAGLQLMKCGGCGGAWYCGRRCQAAHWREGHRGECGGTS